MRNQIEEDFNEKNAILSMTNLDNLCEYKYNQQFKSKVVLIEEATMCIDDTPAATYYKEDPEFSTDKKKNIELWDEIDNIAQEAIEKVAAIAGVKISEFGDLQDVKEVVEHLTEIVKRRFGAETLYVDENY
jgi:hypothetical protein